MSDHHGILTQFSLDPAVIVSKKKKYVLKITTESLKIKIKITTGSLIMASGSQLKVKTINISY